MALWSSCMEYTSFRVAKERALFKAEKVRDYS